VRRDPSSTGGGERGKQGNEPPLTAVKTSSDLQAQAEPLVRFLYSTQPHLAALRAVETARRKRKRERVRKV
jgi:hypothetical protein